MKVRARYLVVTETKEHSLSNQTAKDKLIVPLDVDTVEEARRLVESLRDYAGTFKVGPRLFTSAGPGIVREIVGAGGRVFLDLKFHDIPTVVAGASREATRLGVYIFTVHASGGGEMLRRAAEASAETAAREGLERPIMVAVTVLTSANEETLAETGVRATDAVEQVTLLARLAARSGADGVVASPREIAHVRAAVTRPGFRIVTPGVRTQGSAHDDQRRVMTPAEAVRAGADFLVVGRSIINAPDPARAARTVVEEMEQAGETVVS